MACTQCGVERECDCPSGPPLVHERAAEEIADHLHRRDLRAGRLPDERPRALSESMRLLDDLEAAGLVVVDVEALDEILDSCEPRWPARPPGLEHPGEPAGACCTVCSASIEGDDDMPIPHEPNCCVRALRDAMPRPERG